MTVCLFLKYIPRIWDSIDLVTFWQVKKKGEMGSVLSAMDFGQNICKRFNQWSRVCWSCTEDLLLTLGDNNLADKDVWHINSQCVCLFMVGTVWWRNKMLLILTAGPESLTFWPGQAVFLLIIDDVIIRFPLITIHATVKPYGQIHQKHTGDYGKINR